MNDVNELVSITGMDVLSAQELLRICDNDLQRAVAMCLGENSSFAAENQQLYEPVAVQNVVSISSDDSPKPVGVKQQPIVHTGPQMAASLQQVVPEPAQPVVDPAALAQGFDVQQFDHVDELAVVVHTNGFAANGVFFDFAEPRTKRLLSELRGGFAPARLFKNVRVGPGTELDLKILQTDQRWEGGEDNGNGRAIAGFAQQHQVEIGTETQLKVRRAHETWVVRCQRSTGVREVLERTVGKLKQFNVHTADGKAVDIAGTVGGEKLEMRVVVVDTV